MKILLLLTVVFLVKGGPNPDQRKERFDESVKYETKYEDGYGNVGRLTKSSSTEIRNKDKTLKPINRRKLARRGSITYKKVANTDVSMSYEIIKIDTDGNYHRAEGSNSKETKLKERIKHNYHTGDTTHKKKEILDTSKNYEIERRHKNGTITREKGSESAEIMQSERALVKDFHKMHDQYMKAYRKENTLDHSMSYEHEMTDAEGNYYKAIGSYSVERTNKERVGYGRRKGGKKIRRLRNRKRNKSSSSSSEEQTIRYGKYIKRPVTGRWRTNSRNRMRKQGSAYGQHKRQDKLWKSRYGNKHILWKYGRKYF